MRANPRRPRQPRMRRDEIRRLAQHKLGADSSKALAEILGISETNLSKLLNGKHPPGGIIIATLLDALDARFEEVFTIEPVPLLTPR